VKLAVGIPQDDIDDLREFALVLLIQLLIDFMLYIYGIIIGVKYHILKINYCSQV